MADLVPPAGTPPAEPLAGGQPPAESPAEPGKFVAKTQAEIDGIVEDRLKRDREAREKELGMSHKDAKALIKAKKDADDAAKTAQEKLLEDLAATKKALVDRDLRDLKRQKIEALIAEKKIKLPDNVSISDVLEMVSGQDENGINESAGKLLKFFPFNAQAGAGTNPANPSEREPNLDEQIKAAQAEALKTGDWNKYTQLCMKKQAG